MSTNARKAAPRLAQPAVRYWKGKAPKGIAEVASDDDSDDDAQLEAQQDDGDVPIGGEEDGDEEDDGGVVVKRVSKGQAVKAMNITLKNVDISKEGKVTVAGREESGKTLMEEGSEEEEESDEEDVKPGVPVPRGDADESSEYESGSEEEEPAKPMFRPVFVPKRGRATVHEREQEAFDSEEAIKKRELEAEERRQQSHDLVAESIKRELAEKEKEEELPDLDDTDGLDPTTEFEAWRLRELARIKRDKEDQMRRDEEREEVERRRALPEDQRLKEDLERAQKTREEKPKGQQKFLQKYWHKGAFHQDADILKKHDYTEATSSTVDVSMLPKVMQVRDFGKRSQTKYTHLVDQDTTAGNGGFGGAALKKPGGKPGDPGAGCFACGGPHLKKDCPQMTEGPPGTGSNGFGGPGSSRQWGQARSKPNENDNSWRDRDRDRSPSRRDDGWGSRGGVRGSYDDRNRPREPRGSRGRDGDRDRGGDHRMDDDQYRDRGHERRRPSRSPSPRRDADRNERKGRERRHSRQRTPDEDQGGWKRRRVD